LLPCEPKLRFYRPRGIRAHVKAEEKPPAMRELLRIPGLGAKTALRLWRDAGVGSLRDLALACEENRVASLRGLGLKRQAAFLGAAKRALARQNRILYATALVMARLTSDAFADAGLDSPAVVGEVRRGVELVRELSMITTDAHPMSMLAAALEKTPACHAITIVGPSTIRALFEGGGPLVLRAVPRWRWVEALVRGTGTLAHVRWLERLAKQRGGLTAACKRAASEEELYSSLGVPFAPPELREGPTPRVPSLITNVGGIFHVHTTWSDGTASLLEMAREASSQGFSFLGISEHSKAASYAGGLDAARLREQARAVAEARREVPEITLFHGVEVDILPDGSLDLDDETLATLDFVIASVHVDLDMNGAAMTRRLLRALRHPLVTILGHPTGRLLLGRRESELDLDVIASAAAQNGTLLEINANPQRLDLGDALVRRAAAHGARFAIDPDAHTVRGIADVSLGVTVARRAGLGPSDVFNALRVDDVSSRLAARRVRAKHALGIA
jgi:DNA polymerase (family 10)